MFRRKEMTSRNVRMNPRNLWGLAVVVIAMVAGAIWPSPVDAETSEEVAKELRGYLEDIDKEDADIQFARYLTLAHIGDDSAMETLDETTTSDSTNLQLAARFGQVIAGKDGSIEPLVNVMLKTSDLYELLRTRATLLEDETEVRVINKLLKKAKAVQRRDIYRYLAQQKGPLYEVLLNKIEDDKRREEAVLAVRQTLAPHGLEALADKQNAKAIKVAKAAQSLLVRASKIPGRRSEMIPLLEKGLESPHQAVEIEAARRLLELNDRSGASNLIELFFNSEDTELRIELADTMLKFGVSPETKRLKSLRTSLRAKIKVRERKEKETEKVQSLTDQVFRMLVASGDTESFEKAVEWFRSTNFDRRLVAASAFGYAENEASKSVKLLSRALFEGREDMRLTAAKSLRRLESPDALPALKRAIEKERSLKVKTEVIQAFGAIGTDKALEILRLNTGVRKPEVKTAIIHAVREIGKPEGAKALRIFESARNLKVQWQAYVATLELQPDKAKEKLVDEMRNPIDGFMSDLMTLPTDTFMSIVPTLLRHESTQVHEKAVSTIRQLGAAGMDFARSVWTDPDAPSSVRREALLMVSEYRIDDDQSQFVEFLRNNPKSSLAPRAAWTLTEYGGEGLESTYRTYLPAKPDSGKDGDKENEGKSNDIEEASVNPVVRAIAVYGLASLKSE